MKKVVFMLIALFSLGLGSAVAQDEMSTEEIGKEVEASKDRLAKIQKIIEKRPKACGLASIDGFSDQVFEAGVACAATAEKFENLYARQVSEPDADGVTNVEITKPTLNDWVELLALLTNQAAQITALAPSAANMPNAITEIKNPMQIGKAKKCIQSTGDLFKLIGEENVAEVKAVKGIISMLKSKGNL